ncbi:unnamed protein product, partial [marine sediment metagenome]
EQLAECGEDNPKQFIVDNLQVTNYDRNIPTSLTVFQGHPELKKFDFRTNIGWERKDNTILIYVPYFSDEQERYAALAQVRDLERFVSRSDAKHVLIGYHGNPFPSLMEDERLHARVDHNFIVIQA